MKYLLDVPDAEMTEWKALAKDSGLPFAEWLRHAIRVWVNDETGGRQVGARALPTRRVARRALSSADLASRPLKTDFKPGKK